TLLYIGADAGSSIPVNGVLAIVGEKDADWKTLLKAYEANASGGSTSTKAPAESKATETSAPAKTETVTAEHSTNGRVKASPLAKKMAKDKGIDISKIQGTGDQGRVTKSDVENYKPIAAPAQAKGDAKGAPVVLPSVVGKESFEEVTVSQMRKTI